MALFFCKWEGRAAFLIDASDEAAAIKIASTHGEGGAPDEVTALQPGAFAAEVFVATKDDDDYIDGLLAIDPLEHTDALFLHLLGEDDEDDHDDEDERDVGAPPPSGRLFVPCPAEAEGGPDEATLRCDLEKGHPGNHETRLAEGIFEWSDAEGHAHATH